MQYDKFEQLELDIAIAIGWENLVMRDIGYIIEGMSPNNEWLKLPQWTRANDASFSLMVKYNCYPSLELDNTVIIRHTGGPTIVHNNDFSSPDAAVRFAIATAVKFMLSQNSQTS